MRSTTDIEVANHAAMAPPGKLFSVEDALRQVLNKVEGLRRAAKSTDDIEGALLAEALEGQLLPALKRRRN